MTNLNSSSIQDTETLRREVVRAKASCIDERVRGWCTDLQMEQNILEELAEQFERLNSEALAQEFMNHCPVHSATLVDYKNRWIRLSGEAWALCGIRFRGLDLSRPFIDVIATDRCTRSLVDLLDIARSVKPAYSLFAPKHMRLFVPYDRLKRFGRLEAAFVERCYYARPISQLKGNPAPPRIERVRLEQPADYSLVANRYEKEYLAFQEENPEHREYAVRASREDLKYYHSNQLLFEVLIDERPAGIVAAFQDYAQGMRGYQVGEIFLYKEFRGEGWGSVALRTLIELLPNGPDDILFGTIDSRNVSAVKTAENCGRINVGAYVWLPMESVGVE